MLSVVPKRKDLVLSSPKWMLNLLSFNQSQRLEKFKFNWSSISYSFSCWNVRQIWFAYQRNKSHFTVWGMSFEYNKNKSRPNIDSWGTPQVRFPRSENFLSILTLKLFPDKYASNHEINLSENPNASHFLRSISWSIVSKAFCKLININPFLHNDPFWSYWKHQKTLFFWRFQGDRKGTLGRKGLNPCTSRVRNFCLFCQLIMSVKNTRVRWKWFLKPWLIFI